MHQILLLILYSLVLSWIGGRALLHSAEHPNVLLLCIDDLRPELHCYGVEYIQSPNKFANITQPA